MRKIALSILFVFVFLAVAFAQAAIKAEVDKKDITIDEVVTYKIIVTSTQKDAPELVLPELDGLSVVSSAESSTVSYADNNLKTHFAYVFLLAPRATGTLKIPPVLLKTKAGSMATEAFEIEVKPGKKPVAPLREDLPLSLDNQRPQDSSQVTL